LLGVRPRQRKRSHILILVIVLLLLPSSTLIYDVPSLLAMPSSSFLSPKGGSWLGYKLGYLGMVLMIISQWYSFVKRNGSNYVRLVGGQRLLLRIHCFLDLVGPTLVLIHAGFPYDFAYSDPFKYARLLRQLPVGLVMMAGLATWLTLACVTSGFFGRYLYRRVGARIQVWFKHWRTIHLFLSAFLYLTGMIHVSLVVWFKFISG